MANILDYIDWRGDLSLNDSPFNEVDNLVLSQLVYLEFKDIIPGVNSKDTISLKDAGRKYFQRYEGRIPKFVKNASEMLRKMMTSRRFQKCLLSCYVNDINLDAESQFSAMKIELEDGSVYIAFSGTDCTVVGWKENFNMSFLSAIPGQLKALEYVETTVPFYKNKLRFGGHSKGGNLAVYAAMYASKYTQMRILDVYSNDGPGFTEQMIFQEGYENILPKIHTFLPQSSIIGMLLDHKDTANVIESTARGILQHDPFTWEVKGPSFVHLKSLTKDSILIDKVMKTWLNSLDEAQKKAFVDALFSILTNANIDRTDKLGRLSLQELSDLIKAAKGLTPESREILMKTMHSLFEIYRENKHTYRKKCR